MPISRLPNPIIETQEGTKEFSYKLREISSSLERKNKIYMAVFYSKLSAQQLLEKYKNVCPNSLEREYIPVSNLENEKFPFVISKRDRGINVLFCICSSDFFNRNILRWLNSLYPYIVLPILKQQELRTILISIRNLLEVEQVNIISATSKRWLDKKDIIGKKYTESFRSWTNLSIEEAFLKAKEENRWFTSVSVLIQKKGREVKTSLSRQGILWTNRWFDEYLEVVEKIITYFVQKLNIFSARSRQETKEVRPLSIIYDERIFENKEEREQFINIITKIPNFGYSILHSNPYIQISLYDVKDGSSFELLIQDGNSIILFPQIKSSISAFNRLVGYIFENFKEGEIKDLE